MEISHDFFSLEGIAADTLFICISKLAVYKVLSLGCIIAWTFKLRCRLICVHRDSQTRSCSRGHAVLCLEVAAMPLQTASAGCHVGRTGACGWQYHLPTAIGMESPHHTLNSVTSSCLLKIMIHTGLGLEQIAGCSHLRP